MKAALASRNENKLRELRIALPDVELELLRATDYPPETGETYYENARIKALHGRSVAAADVWVLGEDSGIEVDGLAGAPGVHSARWAGDEDPVEALLRRLDGVDGAGRRARYRCELVAVAPDGRELRGTGVLEGVIVSERSGTGGFGYDPIFVPEGETRTVAELGDAWKNEHSHRACAAASLARRLT